jgi:hypothetical protein
MTRTAEGATVHSGSTGGGRGVRGVQLGTFVSFGNFLPQPQSQSGNFGRTLLVLSVIERFFVHPACSLVTMLTELSRLIN